MPKQKKPSNMVKCGGCKRALLIDGNSGYDSSAPPEGTPAERIHDALGRKLGWVHCTCGHYTRLPNA
jgi:hypothetical protein